MELKGFAPWFRNRFLGFLDLLGLKPGYIPEVQPANQWAELAPAPVEAASDWAARGEERRGEKCQMPA